MWQQPIETQRSGNKQKDVDNDDGLKSIINVGNNHQINIETRGADVTELIGNQSQTEEPIGSFNQLLDGFVPLPDELVMVFTSGMTPARVTERRWTVHLFQFQFQHQVLNHATGLKEEDWRKDFTDVKKQRCEMKSHAVDQHQEMDTESPTKKSWVTEENWIIGCVDVEHHNERS